MPFDNDIELIELYLAILDEKYRYESVTEFLDAPEEIVQETQIAGTVLLPDVELDGLSDYGRDSGFQKGDLDLNWTAYDIEQDRGRQFQIDRFDDLETLEIAFGTLAEEFMRNHVVPEIDAYRFAQMAYEAGNEDYGEPDANDIVEEIDEAHETLTDDEVPMEGRVIFVNPTMFRHLKQSDLIDRYFDVGDNDQQVDTRFYELDGSPLVVVPSGRFYTEIDIHSGSGTAGFDNVGEKINFMIVHPTAVMPIVKHNAPRIFGPDVNQSADAYLFDYRIYHDIIIPDNKTDGIYVHHEPSVE